jgi:UTP:GlnB (protein PII) uridylyltransferase
MTKQKAKSFNLVVRNRPGELAKLTKLLTDAGMTVSGLRVANFGEKAEIRFEVSETEPRLEALRTSSRIRAS